MKEPLKVEDVKPFERLLIRCETPPYSALYRFGVGFAIPSALSALGGSAGSDWKIVPFLSIVLLLSRAIPLVLRKLLPFSAAAQRVWSHRRQLAKRSDSYQWQKLFWIGAGLAAHSVLLQQLSIDRVVLSSVCTCGGLLGVVRWRAIGAGLTAATNASQLVK